MPDERIYMIDKVVRSRSIKGKFGKDHSEALNFDRTTKLAPKEAILNRLVYKKSIQIGEPSLASHLNATLHTTKVCTKISHAEWQQRKATEHRLKSKLLKKAKDEILEALEAQKRFDKEMKRKKEALLDEWLLKNNR